MTARPAPEDSRVTLAQFLDDVHDEFDLPNSRDIADAILAKFLVLDPKSDELVERIARSLSRKFAAQQLDLPVDEYVDRYWPSCVDMARAVLAALAAPGGEPREQ